MIEIVEISTPLTIGDYESPDQEPIEGQSTEGTMLSLLAYAIAASVILLFLLPRLGQSAMGGPSGPTSESGATLGSESSAAAQLAISNDMPGSVNSDGQEVGLSSAFSPEVLYWAPQIRAWSERHGVDPDIVAIIMQIESCGDPQAISSAGAQGLFQVMPFHFDAGEDSLDPDTNAMRGLRYFADRLDQTGGDVGRAFAGYNGGHVAAAANWDSWANETQRYYVWTTGLYSDVKSGLSESPTLSRWMNAGGASLCRQAASRIGL